MVRINQFHPRKAPNFGWAKVWPYEERTHIGADLETGLRVELISGVRAPNWKKQLKECVLFKEIRRSEDT